MVIPTRNSSAILLATKVGCWLLCLSTALAAEPELSGKVGPWSLDELAKTPAMEWVDETKPVRSLLYAGEAQGEKPTQVFAYYASPATLKGGAAPAGAKYPGVVLIHGGGGTAFKEWAALWAKRGYAAIAMDLAGSRPDDADEKKRTRLANGGPGQGSPEKFDTIRTEDVSDDWPYHAVANCLRAHSLLRSFPEVDASRTAVTGISWGGYLTTIVASVDTRFRAAVPVYGCGFLHDNSTWLGEFTKLGPNLTQKWVKQYDPSSYLPRCKVPIFFVNGTNDFAYPLDSYAKSIRAVTQTPATVRIAVNMPHGHQQGWAPAEIGLFIDSQLGVGDTSPLSRFEPPVDMLGRVSCKIASAAAASQTKTPAPLKTAQLHYALPGKPINQRTWTSLPATIAKGEITANGLPADADLFFITATDERGAMVSTLPVVREALSAFDVPFAIQAQTALSQLLKPLIEGKKYDEAGQLLSNALTDRRLALPVNIYNLACMRSMSGELDEAWLMLELAIDRGFRDGALLAKDTDFDPLRKADAGRFDKLVTLAKAEPMPGSTKPASASFPEGFAAKSFDDVPALDVKEGVALVTESHARWSPEWQQFLVRPVFGALKEGTAATTMPGPAGDLVRKWYQEGTAAGLWGVLYDNHDRDHSNMDYARFPQLTRVEFTDAARKRGLDYGLQAHELYAAPTIGNSSTAHVAGPNWGSQTRFALRGSRLANVLARQYLLNQIHFYPEHRDHDEDGHGDVFHANTPYVITSQGSSGSDRAFMHAVALCIAAMTPETQREAIRSHRLSSTVQMLFRRSRKPVQSDDDYLSGVAHPPVFDAATLDLERLVTLSHNLKADEIPPLVSVKVSEESRPKLGIDYFDASDADVVFDTVSAISRVARGLAWDRRIVVEAASLGLADAKGVTYDWRLLQGDAERVTLRKLDEQGSRCEIKVGWHDRFKVPHTGLMSTRVDIGVFARRGGSLSAPAFVSWVFPGNEKRMYDDRKRFASVEFTPGETKENYVDPSLVTPAAWRDTFRYDDKGALLGWTRTRGTATEEFTHDGALVTEKDKLDRPVAAKQVRYVRVQKAPQSRPELQQQPTDNTYRYSYTSDTDRVGQRSP